MPALVGAAMNAVTASVTAVHRVDGVTIFGGLSHPVSEAAHCMEMDLSIMMKRSTAIMVLSRASAAHAASGSLGPRPPSIGSETDPSEVGITEVPAPPLAASLPIPRPPAAPPVELSTPAFP